MTIKLAVTYITPLKLITNVKRRVEVLINIQKCSNSIQNCFAITKGAIRHI